MYKSTTIMYAFQPGVGARVGDGGVLVSKQQQTILADLRRKEVSLKDTK